MMPKTLSLKRRGNNMTKTKTKESKQHGWITIFHISAGQQIVNPKGFKVLVD